MMEMKLLLEKASGITKKPMAVVTKNGSFIYPEDTALCISFEEACLNSGTNYHGWNIYVCGSPEARFFVGLASESYFESELTGLVTLLFNSAVSGDTSHSAYLRKAVDGDYDAAELAILEENLQDCFPAHILLIYDYKDSIDEVLEVMANTLNVKVSFINDNRIIVLADEGDIAEACSAFVKNVLSELLIECGIIIGGRAEAARDLHLLYENCMEALCLKRVYSLGDRVLSYDAMYGYRIANDLDPKLKEFIHSRVFTKEFVAAYNAEMGTTIEEFFRNNLNLTDTAAKLYVHRNTLLYRLEKINKYTGFDLKKFEDSWLFKLAWMINKENSR